MSDIIQIFKPEDCYDQMLFEYTNGKIKGTTTYNLDLDRAWTWRSQEFNIWTGYSNEGKSIFIKQMCLIKALEENKKFIFYSPEDFPPSEFFDDMIHTLAGGSTDRDREGYISEYLYRKCFDIINDLFYFVYIKPPKNTIERILDAFDSIIGNDQNIYGCIIDPILKCTPSKDAPDRDDKYAGYIGSMLVDFARTNSQSLHMVMHQLTPRAKENGLYPEPTMYNVKGGGSWADGVDNVLSIQRPLYAKDKADISVIFGSQKIKKQKLVGIPQSLNLKFNRKTNRYMNEHMHDLFDFNKFL